MNHLQIYKENYDLLGLENETDPITDRSVFHANVSFPIILSQQPTLRSPPKATVYVICQA